MYGWRGMVYRVGGEGDGGKLFGKVWKNGVAGKGLVGRGGMGGVCLLRWMLGGEVYVWLVNG